MKFSLKLAPLVGAATLALSGALWAQSVTDTEIKLGVVTDMSGPIAKYGTDGVNGQTMAMEKINAAGGIHGRKISMVVEDHGYDPKRAVLAAQKLTTQDEVFAVIGPLGTATSMAALPVLIENEVFSFLPQGASPGLYEPANMFKVGLAPAYHEMTATTLNWLMQKVDAKTVCILYQDDDFGKDVLAGARAYMKSIGGEITKETSYKRGATDFSSQVALMKAANCDLVVEGTSLRELVGSVAEARKTGFNPTFLTLSSAYSVHVPKLGGEAVNGVYASTAFAIPYADSPNPEVVKWVDRYRKRFGKEPGVFSMYGYYSMRRFAQIAEAAGKDLTPETFNTAMEAGELPGDELGNPPFRVTADDRLSNHKVFMTQIVDGKWENISDFLDPLVLPD